MSIMRQIVRCRVGRSCLRSAAAQSQSLYVQGCFTCQWSKHLQRHLVGNLVPVLTLENPWDWVTADCITNVPADFCEVLLTLLS